MMIKAGIVVSAAAATLLAVSPLAFAGDYNGGNGHHHKSSHSKDHDNDHRDHRDHRGDSHRGNRGGDKSCDQDNSASSNGRGRGGGGGLLDVSNNTIQVPIQACNNNVLSNLVVGILSKDQSAHSR
jgi:hypothetical protein